MTADSAPTHLTDDEITEALSIAEQLIDAGIPVFAANPCPPGCRVDGHGTRTEFHLPVKWEKTTPSRAVLQQWRPGMGLAAVGGVAADFLDFDPRNGADESLTQLLDAGHMPRVFGTAQTPSGGTHLIISATGERKGSPAPGVDLQAGNADGIGRGFVWIAPTVKRSKIDGVPRAYRWTEKPDLEALAEWRGPDGTCTDESITGIVARLQAKRAGYTEVHGATRSAGQSVDDPFVSASQVGRGAVREFTPETAQGWCRQALLKLREAQIGGIEEACNNAAATLAHFVPEFWTAEQAYALLVDALAYTKYDPNGPSDWTAEKFRPVLDGRRAPLDNWRAVRAPEKVNVEALFSGESGQEKAPSTPEEAQSAVERMRSMLISAADMVALPPADPLVYGLLDMDTEAWIIGAPGSFKSFVALDIAGHVARGKQWCGLRVRQGPVVYIAAEGARGMVLRVRGWQEMHGPMTDVYFLPMPVQVKGEDGQWYALVEACREIKPAMVVIDTQARVTVGLEENSASDFAYYTKAITAMRRATGACVLTVHHTGRDGQNARGSSAIDAAQDTELKVTRVQPRESLRVVLQEDKQKDMAERESGLQLELQVVDLGTDPVTDRELSTLVVKGLADPFATASGIDSPEDWEVKHPAVQAQILKVLKEQGERIGLTKPEVRRNVADRWYGGQTGRSRGLRSSTFDTAWSKVLARTAPDGGPIVLQVEGSQKFVLDLVAFGALNAALAAEDDLHGGVHGGGSK